jgi:hypothetical protein
VYKPIEKDTTVPPVSNNEDNKVKEQLNQNIDSNTAQKKEDKKSILEENTNVFKDVSTEVQNENATTK